MYHSVFQQSDLASKNRQNGNLYSTPPNEQSQSESHYAAITGHHLAFFSDQKSQLPIFKINTSEYSAKFSTTADSLILTHKNAHDPIATIHATALVLEKLQQSFKSRLENNSSWSLLTDTPYNHSTDSILTHIDRNTNYMGVLTIIFVIATMTKMRDIISSHVANGPLQQAENGSSDVLLIPLTIIIFMVTIALMMGIEKLAFKGIISNSVALMLEILNVIQMATITVWYYNTYRPQYEKAVFHVQVIIAMIFRTMSYAHFMHELRKDLPGILASDTIKDYSIINISKENLAIVLKYANNPSGLVRLTDILYHWLTPVLSYQLWYPRTERINKRRALWFLVQLIFFGNVNQYYMGQQVLPALKASTNAFIHGSHIEIAEQSLSAASTYLVYFMIDFYFSFHLVLNLNAELTRLSNRDFYGEWWNCTSVSTFWNKWNFLIHRHFVRHIYKPLLKSGCPKFVASCVVFLTSGIMHEFIFSAPLGRITYYPTFFFSVQALFILLENKLSGLCKKYYPANICLYIVASITIVVYSAAMIRIQYLQLNGKA